MADDGAMVAEQSPQPAPESGRPRPMKKWPHKLAFVTIYGDPIKTRSVRLKCLFPREMPFRRTPDGKREMLDADGHKERMTCIHRTSGGGCRRRRRREIALTESGDCPLRTPLVIIRKNLKAPRKAASYAPEEAD